MPLILSPEESNILQGRKPATGPTEEPIPDQETTEIVTKRMSFAKINALVKKLQREREEIPPEGVASMEDQKVLEALADTLIKKLERLGVNVDKEKGELGRLIR